MPLNGFPSAEAAVSGWGRYPTVTTDLVRPEKLADLPGVIREADGVVPRGLARSYGDAAAAPGGHTVLMTRLDRIVAFDEATGTVRCEAGVSFEDLLSVFVPRGWFPPVTPGTKFVTVGGAVACDVHGKNHHCDGSFSAFVDRIDLLVASGETVSCSRDDDPDLFWATVGGMGLTGIITEVTFRLRRVETAYIEVHRHKARNLDEAFALFDRLEPDFPYSVAWIDCLASGDARGRSVLMLGDHAALGDLDARQRAAPLDVRPGRRLRVPLDMPGRLLNRATMRAFNAAYYGLAPGRPDRRVVRFDSFFYPLDFLWDWNRMYGRRGFVQYQCVFPSEASHEALSEMLRRCAAEGKGSFLAVLKRFGPQEGWLSFPRPGYTLTLDMPVKDGLWPFLDGLDQLVVEHGGRVYLAKDARLDPATFREMYPAFPKWLGVKRRVDPENRFTSALAERLALASP